MRDLQKEIDEDIKMLKQPWAPFLASALLHLVILTGQLSRYLDGEVEGLLTWPIIICAAGGIWDNMRLYHGSRYGEAGLYASVTNIRYVFRMSALPMLFIPLSYVIGDMTSLHFLSVIGRVASVGFMVHGFNEFVIQVAGHYVTVTEHGVTRHTVDPEMRNSSIRLPGIIVAVGGLVAGFTALVAYDVYFTILLQVVCVLGRFASPVYPPHAIALSRGFEALFLYSLTSLQGLVYF